MRCITFRIAINVRMVFKEPVDIVNSDIPLLIGLHLRHKYKMFVNKVGNILQCPASGCNIPLYRKYDHLYVYQTKTKNILFTHSELARLHSNFSYHFAHGPSNLPKLSCLWDINLQKRQFLEKTNNCCNTCQYQTSPLIRFNVSLPTEESLVFGEELSMDLIFLDRKAVPRIAATATRFATETFLDSHGANCRQSVDGVWFELPMNWCSMYTKYPERLRIDQGSIFMSER